MSDGPFVEVFWSDATSIRSHDSFSSRRFPPQAVSLKSQLERSVDDNASLQEKIDRVGPKPASRAFSFSFSFSFANSARFFVCTPSSRLRESWDELLDSRIDNNEEGKRETTDAQVSNFESTRRLSPSLSSRPDAYVSLLPRHNLLHEVITTACVTGIYAHQCGREA